MRIVIDEEGRNRVTWAARSPLLKLLAGLLIAALFLVVLLLPSPSPARWRVVGLVVGCALVIAAILTVTTPLIDGGTLERLPDGGELERTKTWPLIQPRTVLQLPLDEIAAFEVETVDFENAGPTVTTLSRLRIQDTSGAHIDLTDWAEPSSVVALGEAVARVGRRELTRLS
jgi:hypothetical protein